MRQWNETVNFVSLEVKGQGRRVPGHKTKIHLLRYLTNFNETWQAHITLNANCVTTA